MARGRHSRDSRSRNPVTRLTGFDDMLNRDSVCGAIGPGSSNPVSVGELVTDCKGYPLEGAEGAEEKNLTEVLVRAWKAGAFASTTGQPA